MVDFNPLQAQPRNFPAASPTLDRAGLSIFFRYVPFAESMRPLEIGLGSGRIAEIALTEHCGAETRYVGLEFREKSPDNSASKKFSGRVEIRPTNAGEPFPVADEERDLAFTCYFLERLRKDELYMVLSELRRILPPGGIWAALYRTPETEFLRRIGKIFLPKGEPEIDLTHFISPEDWDIEIDQSVRGDGAISRLLVLRRKPA